MNANWNSAATVYQHQDDAMKPFFGQIFNCVLMDRLKAQARAGDKRALEICLASVPKDASRATAVTERDEIICQLAMTLRASAAARTDHAIAVIISTAGEVLQTSSSLGARPEFARLGVWEREQLETIVASTLEWSPIFKRRRWPTVRMIERIIRR